MPFLAINGLTINIADESASVNREPFGEDESRAFSGRLQPNRRGLIRRFDLEVPLENYQDQIPLAGLISGEGHHWSFDANLYSSKGLGPNSGYTVTMSATGGKVGGHVQVTSGQTLTYNYATSSDFTMLVWKENGGAYLQYAYVNDASAGSVIQYKSGAPHTPAGTDNITNWYSFSSGVHTLMGKDIAGTNGNAKYDELLIVPYAMTATMVASFYALVNGGTAFSDLPKLNLTGDIIPETTLEVVGTLPTQRLRSAGVTGNVGSTLTFELVEFLGSY